MDKAYTMMYETDATGKIAGSSPLFQYDSQQAILDSFKLKNPNPELYIAYREISKKENGKINSGSELSENEIALPVLLNRDQIFAEFLQQFGINTDDGGDLLKATTFDTLFEFSKTLSGVQKVKFYNGLLDVLDNYRQGKRLVYLSEYVESSYEQFFRLLETATTPTSNKLIDLLNRHNSSRASTPALKNRIMHGVYAISSDIHNLESSQQLMEMDTMMSTIERVEKTSPGKSHSVVYSYLSPITKYKIQQENSVGKDNVGIAANGVKADGAIQQYFNYALLHDPVVSEKLLTDIDLHFNSKYNKDNESQSYKPIFGKRFVRFANVKMNYGQFSQLCFDKDFSQDEDFKAINLLQVNGSWSKELNPDFYDDYDTKEGKVDHSQTILNPYYQSLYDEWTLYNKTAKIKGEINHEQYKDFLWFRTQFEENAADQLSVYISLATDNAKVLALARLNATPELMSLPLAMTSLGMDQYSVVKVCVNLLDAIADRMSANRFVSGTKKLNVRDVIQQLGKDKVYDEITTQSLLKLYDFAQELRAITSFYKVNQGVDAKYEKLLAWVSSLSRLKLERDQLLSESKGIDGVSIISTIANITDENGNKRYSDIVNQPIDFDRMFTDSDYAQRLSEYCDMTKVGINYIDIILNSPSFRAQLSGVNFSLKSIQNVAFVAGLTQQLMGDFNEEENSEEFSTEDQPDVPNNLTKSDYNIYIKIKDIARHIVISDMLKNKLQYAFKVSDIESEFGKTTLNLGMNTVFDFKTYQGTNTFIRILNDTIIPKLMQQYKDNFFMQSLEQKEDWNTKQKIWTIKYNAFNTEDKSEIANVNQAKVQFETIMKNSSGLKTIDGKVISIGELFFLYDLITRKGAVSSLNTAVRSGVQQYLDLPSMLDKAYREYDQKTQSGQINSVIEQVGIEKLRAIIEALKSDSKSAVFNGKQINLKDSWFYVDAPFVQATSVKGFDLNIKQLFKDLNCGTIKTSYKLTDGNLYISVDVQSGNRTFRYKTSIEGVETSSTDPMTVGMSAEQVKIITDEILANTKSVTEILAELPLSSSSTFAKISELKDYYHGKSGNTLFNKLLNALPDDSDLIVTDDGEQLPRRVNRSFVVKQGDQSFAIIREGALATEINEVYDALLELNLIQRNSSTTENAKINLLISILNPKIGIEPNYQRNIEKLSSADQKKVNQYISYLKQLQIDDHFKKLCLAELTLYQNRLTADPKLYYYSSYKDDTFSIGDKYQKDGVTYLYLGKKKGNDHTFVSINEKEPHVLQLSDQEISKYKKTAQIKRSPLYTLVQLNPNKYKYSGFSLTKIENINITDKVKIGLDDWIVSDIVYDRDESGNYKKQLIVSKDGINKIVDRAEVKSAKSNYQFDSVSSSKNSIVDVTKDLFDYYNPGEDLQIGDQIVYNDTTYSFYRKQSDSVLLVKDNNNNISAVDIKNVSKIIFKHPINPDKSFKLMMEKLQVIVSSSEKKQSFAIYPETFGFTKSNPIEMSNSSLIKYEYMDGDWAVRNIYDHTLLNTTTSIKPGNIIIERTGDIENCYKVLSDNNGTLLLLEITDSGDYNVKKVDRHFFDNKQLRVYSNDPNQIKLNISYISPKLDMLDTMTQKGLKIVDQLEEMFGVDIQIIDDSSDTNFAYIKDGIIYINTSQKPPTMTDGEYIAKQSLHEFTHIALANMQAQQPEAYFGLIDSVRNYMQSEEGKQNSLVKEILSQKSVYESTTEQAEEFIVRYIENTANFNEKTNELEFIKLAMNNGFRQLFKLNSNPVSLDNTVASILGRYNSDFFKETTSDLNINFILNESVLLKMYDNIKEIC